MTHLFRILRVKSFRAAMTMKLSTRMSERNKLCWGRDEHVENSHGRQVELPSALVVLESWVHGIGKAAWVEVRVIRVRKWIN